jgi:hypothetical protein
MRKFFARGLFFFLLLLLSLIPLEILLRNFHFVNDDILSSSVNNFERKKSISTLFVGNSKFYYGISESNCFEKNNYHNFSFPSETIESTYWKLKYYIDKGQLKNLKQVYIQIERAGIYVQNPIKRNNMYDYSTYYKHSFNQITENKSILFKINEWLTGYFTFYRLRPYFIDLILNQINYKIVEKGINRNNANVFGAGFLYSKYSNIHMKEDLPALINDELSYLKTPVNIIQLNYYDKLIRLFKKNGVAVDFIKIIEPIDLVSVSDSTIQKILLSNLEKDKNLVSKRYPDSKLIDLSKYVGSFTIEDFGDKIHLNKSGSIKFSQLLSYEICK